jgi:hypothetical protein
LPSLIALVIGVFQTLNSRARSEPQPEAFSPPLDVGLPPLSSVPEVGMLFNALAEMAKMQAKTLLMITITMIMMTANTILMVWRW